MRGILALSGILLAASALPATPAPAPPGPPPSPAGPARRQAEAFAQQLLSVIGRVAEEYVRPVAREDLLHAALSGLYRAARRPVPCDLRARIRKAAARPSRPTQLTAAVPRDLGPDRGLLELARDVHRELATAESLAGQSPLLVCCRAMAHSLDPYTDVVSGEAFRHTFILAQEFDGVGLDLNDNGGSGPVTVKDVVPGGPAQRAGVRPGDEVMDLDGKPARRLASAAVARMLNQHDPLPDTSGGVPAAGPARRVRVALRRGKETLTVTLEPERFRPETVLGVRREENNAWDYLVDRQRRIAHVRVSTLGEGTADELREVVARLHEGGLRGLVLDLRWCPGGSLPASVGAAEMFLGAGTVATIKARRREDMVYRSTSENKFRDFPMVVLVNGETTGGAELIAAALQDHRRAVVVGQRTRGKASVQTRLYLGVPNVGLKLTSGTFVRPGGKNLHRFPDSGPDADWGVLPEAQDEFRVSPALGRALHEWWLRQTLRPGWCAERLPLDDPDADPQRQAALGVLVRMIKEQPR